MKTKIELAKEFVNSQDCIDICYMIDHIKDKETLMSCLETLGYYVGIDFLSSNDGDKPKTIRIGLNNEIRLQLAPSKNRLALCAIIQKDTKTKNNIIS